MPNTFARLLTLASLTCGLAGVARAEDAPSDPSVRDYHLQILATDVGAAGAFIGGNALENKLGATGDVVMVAGGVTYALGGPVVHVAHGNYGRAAISLGLRVLLPIVGANVGVAFSSCDRNQTFANLCYLDDMAAGFLVGAATAAAADNLLVTPWTTATTETAPARTTRLSLSPRIVANQDRAILGLGGRF
jgi:hypothetical protein